MQIRIEVDFSTKRSYRQHLHHFVFRAFQLHWCWPNTTMQPCNCWCMYVYVCTCKHVCVCLCVSLRVYVLICMSLPLPELHKYKFDQDTITPFSAMGLSTPTNTLGPRVNPYVCACHQALHEHPFNPFVQLTNAEFTQHHRPSSARFEGRRRLSLVIKDDVRFPQLLGRQADDADVPEVRGIPLQAVVEPHLGERRERELQDR